LSENGTDIDIPGSPCEQGRESGEKLAAADAAKRARDRVADLAETVVLETSTRSVTANRTGYKWMMKLTIVADIAHSPFLLD